MKRKLEDDPDLEPKHEITKLNDIQHILYASDMYIGQSVHQMSPAVSRFVYNRMTQAMEFRNEIQYPFGFLKLFDEAVVNAADNAHRGTKLIKIAINTKQKTITVWNDGPNFDIKETAHPSLCNPLQKAYQPELAFFHCKSSSAYTKTKRVTGGKNGLGCKAISIFSLWSVLEMCDGTTYYSQKSADHMNKVYAPTIRAATTAEKTKPFLSLTFCPDVSLFYPEAEPVTEFTNDMVDLFMTRALDLAGTVKGVKILWSLSEESKPQYEKLAVKGFKDYVNLFLPVELKQELELKEDTTKIAHFTGPRWEVCMIKNPYEFPVNVSFVNNINTYLGGEHLKYIQAQVLKFCRDKLTGIDNRRVNAAIMIFVNATIEDPSFNSQSKEALKNGPLTFGSTCELPPKFFNVLGRNGVLDTLKSSMEQKELAAVRKTIGSGKVKDVYDVPNFRDAEQAGTRHSSKCTIIFTEGKSALELAIVGVEILGSDITGAMALKGKGINADKGLVEVSQNEEFINICKVLGLVVGQDTPYERLRYGKIIIMTDSDKDGSHILGLLLYIFGTYWPHLLREQFNFISKMITPIVVSKRGKECKTFYSEQTFETWYESMDEKERKKWTNKYYKGLATSTSAEAKGYFTQFKEHIKYFRKADPDDFKCLQMVFGQKHAEWRKEWLSTYNRSDFIMYERIRELSIQDFLNKDMKHFSMMSVHRAIPAVEDGFTPAARKCIWTFLTTPALRDEVKVSIAQSQVDAATHYQHGSESLGKTIVRLAQNFVGKQNINLLQPNGQYGTRVDGGKTHGATRYICTQLGPLARLIFRPEDDNILDEQTDEGHVIEPHVLAPILPMILVNGCTGIATGYACNIPCYQPEALIAQIRRYLRGEPGSPLIPWYDKFTGELKAADQGTGRFTSVGRVRQMEPLKVQIEELPLHRWTETSKENLISLVKAEKIVDFHECHKEEAICFKVTLKAEIKEAEKLISLFKLRTKYSSNLNVFVQDQNSTNVSIRTLKTVQELFDAWYGFRYKMYGKRRLHLIATLQQSLPFLTCKVRFVALVLNQTIPLGKKKSILKESLLLNQIPEEFHDRLLAMNLSSLVEERITEIQNEVKNVQDKIDYFQRATVQELWEKDLKELEAALPKFWANRVIIDKK